jgi:hypothetical protein
LHTASVMIKTVFSTAALVVILCASPALADWTVDKEEEDPFAPAGMSTFSAGESDDHSNNLGIRCQNGAVFLTLVLVFVGGYSVGDTVRVKLIADAKPIYEVAQAEVGVATPLGALIWFGHSLTLDYLKGAQRVFVHYSLKSSEQTLSFAGGKSMDDVIDKARKACGNPPW